MRRIARLIGLAYLGIVALAVALQLAGVTRFAAPVALLPVPERPPVVVSLLYSDEQQEWITAAAQQFASQNPQVGNRPIELTLRAQGSQVIVDSIARGSIQPTAIIPASSAQIELLNRAWAARNPGSTLVPSGADAPRPVALTPLVLVGWQERVERLLPDGTRDMWSRLHDAVVAPRGWVDLGGDVSWGPVKIGHAAPSQANSGLQTLTLLAYTFHRKANGLNVTDVTGEAFLSWLGEFEAAVTDFPADSEALFNGFLQKGPPAYDVALVYESQVIRGSARGQQLWGPLRIVYPPATTWADHPFAILDAPWSTPEQRAAAALFRDFLLDAPAQRLALQYGFRPASPAVSLNEAGPNNPFPGAASLGVQADLPGAASPPPPEVLDALAGQWARRFRR